MDRVAHLQQRKRYKTTPRTHDEQSDDDTHTLQYVPRHRGDFPPLAFQPSDASSSTIRYEILDRIFEEDLPVYILRPCPAKILKDSLSIASQPPSIRSQLSHNSVNSASRSTSRRSASATSTAESRGYDAADPSILRIDLVDLDQYVTARELEHFETFRFEHPHAEDEPTRVPVSRASSELQREEREQRAIEREQKVSMLNGRTLGRPPKKRTKLVPMVVIESPRRPKSPARSQFTALISGHRRARTYEQGADQDFDKPANYPEGANDEIAASIETSWEEKGWTQEPQQGSIGNARTLGHKPDTRTSPSASSLRPSVKRASTSVEAEQQLLLESQSSHMVKDVDTLVKKQSHTHSRMPIIHSDRPASQLHSRRGKSMSTTRSHSDGSSQSILTKYVKPKSSPSNEMARTPAPMNVKSLVSKDRHKSSPRQQFSVRASIPDSSESDEEEEEEDDDELIASLRRPNVSTEAESGGVHNDHDGDDHVDGEDEDDYEISHIIQHDDSLGMRWFLVAWKGYGPNDNTWLAQDELKDAPDVLHKYLKRLQRAKRQL